MPSSLPPSRRRLVADGRSGKSHAVDSSGLTGRQIEAAVTNKKNRYNVADDDKTRKTLRRNPNFRFRSWCAPSSFMSASRAILTILLAIAMMGVGGGIMVLIFRAFSTPIPVPRYVTIERSHYSYKPQGVHKVEKKGGSSSTNDGDAAIVLGMWPPPLTKGLGAYYPSELESHVIQNGRTDPRLGYDRLIVLDHPETTSTPITSPHGTILDALKSVSLSERLRKTATAPPPTFVDYSDPANTKDMPSGCEMWMNRTVTNPKIYNELQHFRVALKAYEMHLSNWTWNWEEPPPKSDSSSLWAWAWSSEISAKTEAKTNTESNSGYPGNASNATSELRKQDLRDYMMGSSNNNKAVCESLEIHPEGLLGIFTQDLHLSKLPSKSNGESDYQSAYLEPFLPPLRHPEFCFARYDTKNLGEHRTNNKETNHLRNSHKVLENNHIQDTGFIIHDFAAMCRNNLHEHSKTAFFDVEASFDFLPDPSKKSQTPVFALLRLYQKFGFVFDHIYGFGSTRRHPKDIWKKIPDDIKASYHLYNVGIDVDPSSYANPFRLISENYKPEDFVVVKIDTKKPRTEISLVHQLLQEEFDRTSQSSTAYKLSDLIDVFYFDHKVTMRELALTNGDSMIGSMQDSMEFFTSLRQHGIAAHYWI